MQTRKLSFIVPDLFDPVPLLKQVPVSELPPLTLFSTLLSRGQYSIQTASADYYACLFAQLTGSYSSHSGQLPIASVSYLADSLSLPADKWIMRADPCFMMPDRDQLILAENKPDITLEEAKILVEEINQFFKKFAEEHFWSLYVISAQRWYIISDKPINIQAAAPDKVLMKSVKSFLLKGEDSQHWINCFNEIQMILHQSSINKQRLKEGRLAINSVWFWGASRSFNFSHKAQKNKATHCIYSDNIVAQGLSLLHHYEYHHLPQQYQLDSQFEQTSYIIEDFTQALHKKDIISWLGLLQQYEKNFLSPIFKELKSGKLAEVEFISPSGKSILITNKLVRRWWKRLKPYYMFF